MVNTTTEIKTIEVNNLALYNFINGLAETDEHNSVYDDTVTRSLAINIVDSLGGEKDFLAVYKRIVEKGLRRTKTSFTTDDAVRIYSNYTKDVIVSINAITKTKSQDYLFSRVADRIGHIQPGGLAELFEEVADEDGKYSTDRRALNQLMADICVEDFCQKFLDYDDDQLNTSSMQIQ